MHRSAVITGIGMITPLGGSPTEVLDRIRRGDRAAAPPPFDTSALACKLYAPVADFQAERYLADSKSIRLMNRDAQLAAAAAALAVADAGLTPGATYPAEDIALYGSTGLAGLPAEEVANLVKHSADPQGRLDLRRFGRIALKRVRPVLSFKILANMPICFVSIFQNVRGENAVYTPWEGHGAQALVAGIRAIQDGRTPCALVGGCDVRTHELAFVSLQQLGVMQSWADRGAGPVPGEGAAFLVLEEEGRAAARGARAYARVAAHALGTAGSPADLPATLTQLISAVQPGEAPRVVAAGDGDVRIAEAESQALGRCGLTSAGQTRPKHHLGNLYAAAAAVQVGLAAAMARPGRRVLANCFGHGSGQGAFLLEGA